MKWKRLPLCHRPHPDPPQGEGAYGMKEEIRTFVRKILNLRATRVGTFQKNAGKGENIASMSVSKIRGRRDDLFTHFATRSFIVTYKRPQFCWQATGLRQSCNKGLTGLP